MFAHVPVLSQEVLQLLRPERGGLFVDCTLGMGGHAEALLAANPGIRLIGIDQDEQALAMAKSRLGKKIEYRQGNFADLEGLLLANEHPDGMLMDIGVSSFQLDTPERGFSFQEDGPLDMRMDLDGQLTAADILNSWPEPKLADLFFTYGEERLSRKLARLVVEQRRKELFQTTRQLEDLAFHAYPPQQRHRSPHPATRIFQALRIAVNRELEVLESGLPVALARLAPDGVLVVISFHSLEDRIVKRSFRDAVSRGGYELLTRKPLTAGPEEEAVNPRSRSAKLRAIRRLPRL